MSQRVRRAWFVVLSLLVSSAPLAAQKKEPLSRDWKRLRTAHYTIVGNASDGELRRTATGVERFRQALVTILPNLRMSAPVPTLVVVLRDRQSLDDFSPIINGRRAEVGGYFMRRPTTNYMVLGLLADNDASMRIILHEYTHFLVERNLRRAPQWVNEGLAELYSTFREHTDGKSVLGAPPPGHTQTLRTEAPIPLRALMNGEVKLYADNNRTGVFYAESWALTHMLVLGANETRSGQLAQFVAELERGRPVDDAFKAAFKTDYATLEKELQRYVYRRLFNGVVIAPQDEGLSLNAPIERLTEADAQQMQAELFLLTGRPDAATKAVRRALELSPSHARATLLAGRLALELGEYDRAIESLTAAAAADPSDYAAPYHLGLALAAGGRPKEAALAFERAVLINGDIAALFLPLSLARDAIGDTKGADAAFARAMNLEPDPDWFRQRSYILMQRNRGEQAALDAVSYLRDAGWQTDSSPYQAMLAVLGFRQGGRAADAQSVLDAALASVNKESWEHTILRFLAGQLTGKQLVDGADDNGKLTEAHTYVGLVDSLAGRRDEALVHLRWVKEKGSSNYVEYPLALAELRRLESKPAGDGPR